MQDNQSETGGTKDFHMDFLNSENSSKLSRGTSAYTSILLIWEDMSA